MINNINYRNHIDAKYGLIEQLNDVTDIFISNFVKNNKIIIPPMCKFNDFFGDPVVGCIKYLILVIDNKRHIIREGSNQNELVYEINIYNKKITIVYYAYINNDSDWVKLISDQLIDLYRTGLLAIAEFYAHVTGDKLLCQYAIKFIKTIIPDAEVYISFENKYEYPGIHLVWQLAHTKPDNIFLYFHSKGMSYNATERRHDEKQIFQEVVKSWRRVLNIFSAYWDVNKVGLAIGDYGFAWFNFWWARGSYLVNCDEPLLTDNRWFYETWLGKKIDGTTSVNDCYSLSDNQPNVYCDATGACIRCNTVILRE